MKIVQIISSLEQGGAEKLVVDMANELCEKHEVYIVTFKGDADETNMFYLPILNKKVHYINMSFQRGIKLKDITSLYKTLKNIKPDVVHCHLHVIYHTFFYSFFNRKVKSFHTIHNDAKKDCLSKTTKHIRKFFYGWNVFKPITISDQSHASFVNFYGLSNAKLIYNGTQPPVVSKDIENVKKEVKSYKKTGTEKVLVHVSRFHQESKNHLMLIENFNKLVKEGFQMILLILGRGFDSEEAKFLKEEAGEGIHFCGTKNNIPDYLNCADAFCLSSIHEGMPISLLEAFACGCVPICTPVGGIKDLISDGQNGYLSKDTSKDAYYTAMKRYLSNGASIERKELVSFFTDRFTISKCAADHEKLYAS